MSSSLPNHDAKDQKGKTKKRQKTKTRKTQEQTASDTVRAKKKYRK